LGNDGRPRTASLGCRPQAGVDDLLVRLCRRLDADNQAIGQPAGQGCGSGGTRRHPDRDAAERWGVEFGRACAVVLSREVELFAVQEAAHDCERFGHARAPLLVARELPPERPLVQTLSGADAERESAAGQTMHGSRRLCDQRRVIVEQGAGDRGRKSQASRPDGGGAEPRPGETCGGRVVDPRVEVVGNRQGVEPHRFRVCGVLQEYLGLKLLAAAEIGKLGHRFLRNGLRWRRRGRGAGRTSRTWPSRRMRLGAVTASEDVIPQVQFVRGRHALLPHSTRSGLALRPPRQDSRRNRAGRRRKFERRPAWSSAVHVSLSSQTRSQAAP
jgi:hypothetical protein